MESIISQSKPAYPFFWKNNVVFRVNIRSSEKGAENLENKLKKLILREAENEDFDSDEA